jgi:hypothetical protein
VRHPQALGQEKLQLVAEALAPMAQVRALVRKLVLEELLSSELLEVRVVDPALAHAFVGQAVNVLEQKKPDHKPCRNSGPTTLAVQRRQLAVDEIPVDLARELHQLVSHIDDLVQSRAEQITRSCRLVLLRPHRFLRYGDRITLRDSRESAKRNCKLSGLQTPKACFSTHQNSLKRLPVRGLDVLHGRRVIASSARDITRHAMIIVTGALLFSLVPYFGWIEGFNPDFQTSIASRGERFSRSTRCSQIRPAPTASLIGKHHR